MLLSEAFLDNCQILTAQYFFINDILVSMRSEGQSHFRCSSQWTSLNIENESGE